MHHGQIEVVLVCQFFSLDIEKTACDIVSQVSSLIWAYGMVK